MAYVPEFYRSRQAAERMIEQADEQGEDALLWRLYATRPELRRAQQKSYRDSGRSAIFRKVGTHGH